MLAIEPCIKLMTQIKLNYWYYWFLNNVVKLDIYTNVIRLAIDMVFLHIFILKTPYMYFLERRN